jgi:hypothetical protein
MNLSRGMASILQLNGYLLIAQSLLTDLSKISAWVLRALYTGVLQCIANQSDSSWFFVGF